MKLRQMHAKSIASASERRQAKALRWARARAALISDPTERAHVSGDGIHARGAGEVGEPVRDAGGDADVDVDVGTGGAHHGGTRRSGMRQRTCPAEEAENRAAVEAWLEGSGGKARLHNSRGGGRARGARSDCARGRARTRTGNSVRSTAPCSSSSSSSTTTSGSGSDTDSDSGAAGSAVPAGVLPAALANAHLSNRRTSREQRVFNTIRSVISRYGWKVRLQSVVVYITHISMFTSLLLLLRNADGGAAKVNVQAVPLSPSSVPAMAGPNITLTTAAESGPGPGPGPGPGSGPDQGPNGHSAFQPNITLQFANGGNSARIHVHRDQLCQLEYLADPGPRSPLNAPSPMYPSLPNVYVWTAATAMIWLEALAYGVYLARLVARDYRDIVHFNESDMHGLSRVRRRFKISRFWVDYIVLEVLGATLLLLCGTLYAYSLVYRIASCAETRFRSVMAVEAGARAEFECACRIDTRFLIDLTVSVGLLNAKAFSVLLGIWDAERKHRLLFFTGNMKVTDYILTRVGDYDARQTDRTRRLASVALDRVSGGKLAGVLETNLNRKFSRQKKIVQGVRGAAKELSRRLAAQHGRDKED